MDIVSYFKRIGYAGVPRVDLITLSEIHLSHTLSIPFENLTPFTHQEVLLDLPSLEQKMLHDDRGGYCFEQNILLSNALRSLGFKVRHLGARVLMNQADDLITRRSHMILLVDLENETYLVDAGFGALVLTSPIKLEMNTVQKTAHENFRLVPVDQDYKLQAEVAGVWKTLYRFDLVEQYPIDSEVSNFHVYNHPTSHFRHKLIVTQPMLQGRQILSDTLYSFYHSDGRIEKTELTTVLQILGTMTNKFGIKLPEGPLLETRLQALIENQKPQNLSSPG